MRIIIANQAGDRICPGREATRSSSTEPIRVVRRTEVVDLPKRLPRTRSVLRSSSYAEYVDSATQYIEDWGPPRYLSGARPGSRVSYIEEVEQPRYRSRPRSSSHVSYVEERPRHRSRPRNVSRRRARSSSQVRFVDETDESVSASKPRRLKRRRVVYFDGPAETEKSEQQAYSRTPSNHRSTQDAASRAVLIEDSNTTYSQASEIGTEQDRGAELTKEQSISRRCSSSRSHQGFNPILGMVSDHNYRQPSATRSYAYKSDHEAIPRPAICHAEMIQGPDEVEEPPRHHSPHIDFEGPCVNERFNSPTPESREPSRHRTSPGPERPHRERRRRVRESDESSGPDDDDYPRPSPLPYRHVEAPEPPARCADLLVDMLRYASITQSTAQYARGRPSHRNHYSESDTPSPSYPRRFNPSEDREDGYAKYGGRRLAGETLYGSSSPYGQESKSNAEYNWMT